MKRITRKRTGVCFVCGKSTALLIHSACSRALADEKQEAARLRKGRITAKRYAAGRGVPGSSQ